jgi:hypothetical protein
MEIQELKNISIEDFLPLLGTKLTIEFNHQYLIDAELNEVLPLNNYSPLERKPFRINFRTPQKNEYFVQAIYKVHHPKNGLLEIFLCPKGFDEVGMNYEAIFS